MQLLAFRRQYRRWLPAMDRLMLPVLLIILLLVFNHRAEADTPVTLMTAEQQLAYATNRVYAGRTVAGRVSDIGFKRAGELHEVRVDLGARVAAGDVLAVLDQDAARASLAQADADVTLAAAALEAAAARAELARQTEARFAGLRASGHVSAQEYDERALDLRARQADRDVAEAALARARAAREASRIALDESRLVAPFNGVIQARHHDEGSQLQPGQPLLRLVESGRIEAHVGVPETQTASLTPGSRHRLRWQGQDLDATVLTVLPELDTESRTRTAVFALDTTDVPVGTLVELPVAHTVPEAGFWLPLAALTESERGLWGVFVLRADQTVERRLVDIVHAEAARAYVRGTVGDGEQVVAAGVQRLVPGQRVLAAAP